MYERAQGVNLIGLVIGVALLLGAVYLFAFYLPNLSCGRGSIVFSNTTYGFADSSCSWGGGNLNVSFGVGDASSGALVITGANDSKTYVNVTSTNACATYVGTYYLPKQKYNIHITVNGPYNTYGCQFISLEMENATK